MTRYRLAVALTLTAICCLYATGIALADTVTVTRTDGYTVTLTGPTSAKVGKPATYTATCGYPSLIGPCPYGELRAYGGPINRLGEGFGRGPMGTYSFRAAGFYYVRYRVGAGCVGSPRLACPIDVWLGVGVVA